MDKKQEEEGKDSSFYMVIDGEATQLKMLEDIQVMETIKTNNIDIGKGPASCSGVCGNALDCGNLHKAIKGKLRGKEGVGQGESPNSELEERIRKHIAPIVGDNKKNRKISTGIVHLLYG